MKFLEFFDWTDALLTETEKQPVEDLVVEYHNNFATHRTDNGMNTEFKVKLTPKDDKAVYSQNLPMPMHLKEHLIVDLILMHKYQMVTVLLFSQYASPILHRAHSTENYVSLWISGKSTPLLQTIILTLKTQSALCQMQHNTWQGNVFSASLIALRLLTVCRWRTNGQWKCLQSILPVELLPTGGLHKVLANWCLPFELLARVHGPGCQR